jgi:hypothetical protein
MDKGEPFGRPAKSQGIDKNLANVFGFSAGRWSPHSIMIRIASERDIPVPTHH